MPLEIRTNQEQYQGYPDPAFFNTSSPTKVTLTKSEDKCLLPGKGSLKQCAALQREPASL